MGTSGNPMIKVLVAVHDLGGARALHPVLAMLGCQESVRLEVIAEADAARYLESVGVRFAAPPAMLDTNFAGEMLASTRPDVLLTGTSWGSELEQYLRNAAVRQRIPSLVLIDYWTNYRLRWQGAEYPITELADWVCLPDSGAATEMTEQGFPTNRLLITGQPHLENLLRSTTPQKSLECLHNILLLSQQDIASHRSMTTKNVLAILIQAIARSDFKPPVTLTIKPHPKESNLNDLASIAVNPNVTVRVIDCNAALDRAISAADLVIGYFSMALFEARAACKPAIAIELEPFAPSLRYALRSFGIHTIPLDESAIVTALGTVPAAISTSIHNGATARVVQAILDLAGGVAPLASLRTRMPYSAKHPGAFSRTTDGARP